MFGSQCSLLIRENGLISKLPSTRTAFRVSRTVRLGRGRCTALNFIWNVGVSQWLILKFHWFILCSFFIFSTEISKLFQLDIFRIALECFIFKMSCEIRLWTCFRISHPFQVHIDKLFVFFIEIIFMTIRSKILRIRTAYCRLHLLLKRKEIAFDAISSGKLQQIENHMQQNELVYQINRESKSQAT